MPCECFCRGRRTPLLLRLQVSLLACLSHKKNFSSKAFLLLCDRRAFFFSDSLISIRSFVNVKREKEPVHFYGKRHVNKDFALLASYARTSHTLKGLHAAFLRHNAEPVGYRLLHLFKMTVKRRQLLFPSSSLLFFFLFCFT